MTVVPLNVHELGTKIDDDGPLLPAACISPSDCTDMGSSTPGEVLVGADVVVANVVVVEPDAPFGPLQAARVPPLTIAKPSATLGTVLTPTARPLLASP